MESSTTPPLNKAKTKKQNDQDEFDRLKILTQKLIAELEKALSSGIPEDAAIKEWQKKHDWLFGSKHSLIATLETLVDLMLELDKVSKTKPAMLEQEIQEFSAADAALVKAFLAKSKK